MKSDLTHLAEVLQASIERNGSQMLTSQHLLNIINMANRNRVQSIENHEKEMDTILNDSDPLAQGK